MYSHGSSAPFPLGIRINRGTTRGTCTIEREGEQEPSAVFTIGPVEFLRLVTGNLNGPELFMTGRITVEGDLMLAAIVQSWFRVPGQRTSAGA